MATRLWREKRGSCGFGEFTLKEKNNMEKKNRKAGTLFLHRKSHVTEWLLEDYSVLPLGKGVQLGATGCVLHWV